MKLSVLMMIARIVMLGPARATETQTLTPAQMESYHRLTNQLIAGAPGGNRLRFTVRPKRCK